MASDLRAALLSEKAKLEAELAAIDQLLGGSRVLAQPRSVQPVAARRERLSQEAIEEALARIVKLLENNEKNGSKDSWYVFDQNGRAVVDADGKAISGIRKETAMELISSNKSYRAVQGLRSEQIRADLNMNKKLFQYAAHLGKTSDQLTQTGERRSTVYSLPVRQAKTEARTEKPARVIKRKKQ